MKQNTLLACSLVTLAALSSPVAKAALIGHWEMNEASGNIADSSGNNLTGTAAVAGTGMSYSQASVAAGTYGALTVDAATAASFGTAIDFGVDAGNRGNFTLGGAAAIDSLLESTASTFTIMAWINLDSISGTQRLMATGPTGGWGFGTNSDDLRFTKLGVTDNTHLTTIVTGTWTHIAMTYNANTWEGFVNGVSVGSVVAGGGYTEEAGTDFRIGAQAAGDDQFFGKMDNLKVFNTALTVGEIQAAAIPEPSTYGLMGAGALAAVSFIRRRRKAA